MPNYLFKDDQGNIHERFYRMSDAPNIGSWIEADGIRMQRVASVTVGTKWVPFGGRIAGKYPYVSRALPKNLPECPKDASGRPIIKSLRHENELRKNLKAKHGIELVEIDRAE